MSPPSDPTTKQRAAGETRNGILRVALDLFGKHGFEATSLQQIADELAVTKAALYYHFKSKDDLLLAVLDPYFQGMAALMQAKSKAGDADEPTPERAIESYLGFLLENREILSYLSRDAAALARPEVGARVTAFEDLIADRIAGANLARGDEIKATFALGGMRSAITTHASTPAGDLRRPILDSVEAVLNLIPGHTSS